MRGRCYVELKDGLPIRIFRNRADAVISKAEITEWPRFDATHSIRNQVEKRANGSCEFCGKRITTRTGHMHEKVSRGDGGEISLDNSVFICYKCHFDIGHPERRWGGQIYT